MQRTLASIQKITALSPIKDADRIERATILGWNVVVRKNEFSVGDRCVFFEIDSILPDVKWAAFMAPMGFRVRTMKLKGCISQGLALPLHILPKGDHGSYKVGFDVTDELGIRKYEPPFQGPDVIGLFPPDVPKTDEIRLQSVLDVLDEIKTAPCYITIKLDGMSGTFIRREDCLQVCMRNTMIKEGTGAHWSVANKYDLINKLPVGFAIQGEVVGPGILKNRLGLKSLDLFIFNVFDIKQQKYLSYNEFIMFCLKHGLKTVPVEYELDDEDLEKFPFTLEYLLELAKGKYASGIEREGIVIRPKIERYSPVLGGRLSFKVISNDYLLKEED